MKSSPQPNRMDRRVVPLKEGASVTIRGGTDAGQIQTIGIIWIVRDSQKGDGAVSRARMQPVTTGEERVGERRGKEM